MADWKRGLPRGKYYPGMTDNYEVAFAPLAKWHRRRTSQGAFVHASARAVSDSSCCKNYNAPRIVMAFADTSPTRETT